MKAVIEANTVARVVFCHTDNNFFVVSRLHVIKNSVQVEVFQHYFPEVEKFARELYYDPLHESLAVIESTYRDQGLVIMDFWYAIVPHSCIRG